MMSRFRPGLWYALFAAALTIVTSTVPAVAQSSSRTAIRSLPLPEEPQVVQRYNPATLEEVRDDWLETMNAVHLMTDVQANPAWRQGTFDAMARISTATDAELEAFRRANVDPRSLGRFARMMEQQVKELNTQALAADPTLQSSAQTGFPNASYTNAYPCTSSTRSDTVGNYTARGLLFAARAVWAAADRACNEVVAGFNGTLACIAADVLLAIAEGVYDKLVFCDADIDSAEIKGSYDRLLHLHTDIADVRTAQSSGQADIVNAISTARQTIVNNDNSNKNSIVSNDNSNRDTIINNDNSNKSMIVSNDNLNTYMILSQIDYTRMLIINNDNANTLTLVNLNLRLAIEEDLKKSDLPIVLFMLPESQGGHILRVSQIVSESMMKMNAVGVPTPTAQVYFGLAETERIQGHYHQAYGFYRIAYQAVSRP